MNKWIFSSILLLPLLILQPAFSSIVIFEEPNFTIQQGEERIMSFSILGDKNVISIGELVDLPEGLAISILKDEISSTSGVIQVSAEASTLPGETMIKILHGDEVYFLSVTVLQKEAGIDFYLITATLGILLVVLLSVRSRLPSMKFFSSFRKMPLVIVFLLIINTMIMIPAFGALSTVDVIVEDDEARIEVATVVLFDSDYNFLSSTGSDVDGVASFSDLENDRYIYEVYFQEPNLRGEFWGSGVLSLENDGPESVFIRSAPKIIDTEFLSIEENKISITGNIINSGLNEMNIVVNLLIDRDKSSPIDEIRQSEIIDVAPDSVEVFEFVVDLIEPGAYYSSIYLSLSNSVETITDQIPWVNVANMYGSIVINLKDAEKKTRATFFLFDESYNLLDNKNAKGSKIVKWKNLYPMNYIIETYHRPLTSLDLIEFWGAITTQVSENNIDFVQMSPTIEDVKLSKDDDLQIVEVIVSNSEGYAKQVRVSLIIDSNKKMPFNVFQESEIIVLESDKETDFTFSINKDIFSKGEVYVLLQSMYNNNFIITDQLEWIKLK